MSGYDLLAARLTYAAGGNAPTQENINNQNKLASFEASMTNAEQLEHIHLGAYNDGELEFCSTIVDCEINPDKLAESYDQKKISITYDNLKTANMYDLKGGTIIHWPRLGHLDMSDQEEIVNMSHDDCMFSEDENRKYAYWIVLERDLEEKAYVRARIRRCNYQIDVNGHMYKIALKGPNEIGLNWNNVHNVENNRLNYTTTFYVSKDEITNGFFTRHQRVKFDDHNWKVVAVDRYTLNGIIKIHMDEDFDNEMEKDQIVIENITEQALKVKAAKETPEILGDTVLRPYDEGIEYKMNSDRTDGIFKCESNKIEVINKDDGTCIVNVLTSRSAIGDENLVLIYEVSGSAVARLPLDIKSL